MFSIRLLNECKSDLDVCFNNSFMVLVVWFVGGGFVFLYLGGDGIFFFLGWL